MALYLTGTTQEPFRNYDDCVYQTEDEKRNSFQQNMYTERAILSLYTYAKALKMAHASLCQGNPGICSNLAQMSNEDFTQYLKDLNFTFTMEERIPSLSSGSVAEKIAFDSNGDLTNVMFDVYNYKLDQTAGFDFIKVSVFMVMLKICKTVKMNIILNHNLPNIIYMYICVFACLFVC